jgi:hypothetical protein
LIEKRHRSDSTAVSSPKLFQNPQTSQISLSSSPPKWPLTITTTTTKATLLPQQQPPAPVAATLVPAAAHPMFPNPYQTHFSKPLLFTFFNQPHKIITNIIIIIIITILTLNLSNSILKTNTNITNDLKTHASKKSQLPIPFSPLCFAASMPLSPRSTIFPFLLLHLHITVLHTLSGT